MLNLISQPKKEPKNSNSQNNKSFSLPSSSQFQISVLLLYKFLVMNFYTIFPNKLQFYKLNKPPNPTTTTFKEYVINSTNLISPYAFFVSCQSLSKNVYPSFLLSIMVFLELSLVGRGYLIVINSSSTAM